MHSGIRSWTTARFATTPFRPGLLGRRGSPALHDHLIESSFALRRVFVGYAATRAVSTAFALSA